MIIDITGTLLDGRNFEQYHRDTMNLIAGEPFTKGSTIDRLYWVIDAVFFTANKWYDEIDKAKDIDYMHGLELDDKGDEYQIYRNGMDDERYRFMIKAHNMVTNSGGTLQDLINITTSLLNCTPDDINISDERKLVNGQFQGNENTVVINSININSIENTENLELLAPQLNKAVLASTKVREIGFYDSISNVIYTGMGITMNENLEMPVTGPMVLKREIGFDEYTATVPAITENIELPITNGASSDRTIEAKAYTTTVPIITEHITLGGKQ